MRGGQCRYILKQQVISADSQPLLRKIIAVSLNDFSGGDWRQEEVGNLLGIRLNAWRFEAEQ
jgi:hypothetical protein